MNKRDDKPWFQHGAGFLCLPVEAIRDRRLGLPELRVLMALAKHADKAGKCYPSRTALSDWTGMHEVSISQATTKLLASGWLSSREKGNVGKATRYSLAIPPDEALGAGPPPMESPATRLMHRRREISQQLEDTFSDPAELAAFRKAASAAEAEQRKVKKKPRPALGSKPKQATAKPAQRHVRDGDE